jgi:A118 family predicted phage portal protein
MSLWSLISTKLKEILKKMIGGRTIEQTLHVTPIMSSQMENAIEEWSAMYKNQAPWLKEPTDYDPVRIVSLGLPALIASEKARTALLEMESEITTPTKEVEKENPDYTEPEPDEYGNLVPSMEPKTIIEDKPVSDTARAEYLNEQYKKLKRKLRTQIEYGIAKGGLVIKPYLVANPVEKPEEGDKKPKKAKDGKGEKVDWQMEFDFIQADNFYPLAFDASGQITEAAFIQTQTEKDIIFRRLEYHKWQNNTVTIINKAFKSSNKDNQGGDTSGVDLGQEVPLTVVSSWKDLKDKVVIKNIQKPLFAYFKMPEANTIDTSSPLGVSGYSRAVSLIKDADMQYSRLLWEYEAGEMAIDIDRDAMSFQEDGKGNYHTRPNHMQARLFRKVDLGESDTYQPYAPTLRDASFVQGLNTILMRIEDVTGLSRGTLSDAATEARTATELKILKQRSYQTNADIQQAIEDTLRDVIYIMNAYCDLYEITKEGEYDVSFEWDDSIIVDVDTELGKRITLMQNGLSSKVETRMWYFGETKRQAEQALKEASEESLQDAENDMILNSNNDDREFNFGKKNNNKDKKDKGEEE